ncbi:adenylylsulfate kinase [Anaerolineae bacterium]|nr:adenylylsulfate kinase [Anaerolineae bacterium]
MPRPLLILITGAPGAGKTTLARRIAAEFHLPLIAKDDIKESLFDSLGWKDREWSKQLGRATYDLVYYFVATQLAAGRSLIVESNFDATSATAKFRALRAKHDFALVQILLKCDGDVLVERFQARSDSGTRHPGHGDLTAAECDALRNQHCTPLDLDGAVFEIDTTNFDHVDYTSLFEAIRTVRESREHLHRTPSGVPVSPRKDSRGFA